MPCRKWLKYLLSPLAKELENSWFSRAPFLRVSKEGEIRLNCPFCGAEMESGALQSTHGIYWVSSPKHVAPQWHKAAEGLCDVDNWWQAPYAAASRCTKCRKIIVNY